MTWFHLRLARGARHIAQETWQQLWGDAAPQNPGAAVFAGRNGDGHSGFFFTPGALPLAVAFGAQPCRGPAAGDVRLVVGDRQAWVMHFRDGDGPRPAQDPVLHGRARAMTWWMPQAS